jgi:DNA polymerase III subunit beta
MKFSINRDHFTSGLQQVLNVVGTRPTMPILGNVLIEAKEDYLLLTTTNLELGIRCRIEAQVTEAGGITLPVRRLAQIVRELPSLEVTMEGNERGVQLSSGSSRFRIMGMPAEEFPALPNFDDKHSFILPQIELQRMLKLVSYAQSADETRYIMNGVFFNFEEDKLTLAATDGRRLAVISRELEVTEENTGRLILPAKTVTEVERLLGQGEHVRIAFNDRQAAFEIGTADDAAGSGLRDSIYLVSKVVEGNYPNYHQVIPKDSHLHVKVNRENLYSNVRRASLVISEKSNSVKLRVCDGQMEISGESSEIGDAQVSLSVEYEGPEVSVSFNPTYIMDPLRALTRDEVIFVFKDELSPGMIRTQDGFLCVIMPLRT